MQAKKFLSFGLGFTLALALFVSITVFSQSRTDAQEAIPLLIEVAVPIGTNETVTTQQTLLLDLDSMEVIPASNQTATDGNSTGEIAVEQPSVNETTAVAIEQTAEIAGVDRAVAVQVAASSSESAPLATQATGSVQANPTTTEIENSVLAQSESIPASIIQNANLRAGPGIDFDVACQGPAGAVIQIIGRNEDASWFVTDNGEWIASFLLETVPDDVPVLTPESFEEELNANFLPLVEENTAPSILGTEAQVVRAIDGNLIEVMLNGQSELVRYIGVETPSQGRAGYKAATTINQELVNNKAVILVTDGADRDADNHLLRHVYLADGTHINAKMIAQGWAQPRLDINAAYIAEFQALAVQAANAQKGFWSGVPTIDGAMAYGLTLNENGLRAGPGTDFESRGMVSKDVPLTILGRNLEGDWLQVRLPDSKMAWVSTAAIQANVNIATIPLF